MLATHGHTVLSEDETADDAVWVMDAPGMAALDALTAQRYTDLPRAAVILTDDPALPQQLARAGLRGWACLARDADAEQLELAVRSAEAGLVLLDLPFATTSLSPVATMSAPAYPAEALTPRE